MLLCHVFGFLPLRRFLGRGVGYHERNKILLNQSSGLQQTCAAALDCDAILALLLNDSLFYRQSNPMLPFSAFDPVTITAQ